MSTRAGWARLTETPRVGGTASIPARSLSMTESLRDTLAERATTHGDYGEHAAITQSFKYLMHGQGWDDLTDCEREALDMIAHKIGRILAGNPHFRDHWIDIAGYAQLVADRSKERV